MGVSVSDATRFAERNWKEYSSSSFFRNNGPAARSLRPIAVTALRPAINVSAMIVALVWAAAETFSPERPGLKRRFPLSMTNG